MELKKIKTLFFIIMMLCFIKQNSFAQYIGPSEVVSGVWGSRDSDFGIEYGDTSDIFPNFIINSEGKFVVRDGVNRRVKIYLLNGDWMKNVLYRVGRHYTELTFSDEYGFSGDLVGYMSNGSTVCYRTDQKKYIEYSPSGILLQTYNTRPLEMGVRTFKCKKGIPTETKCSRPHYEVEYPDSVYVYETNKENMKGDFNGQIRISNSLVIDNQKGSVYAYVVTSTVLAVENRKEKRYLGLSANWQKPKDDYEDIPRGQGVEPKTIINAEYGDPIIGPDGSVYCWMRSKNYYKIIKWTWQGQ